MGYEKIIRNTRYYHPIRKSNNVATLLKHEMKCNDVVAHSHLKNNYEHNKAGDVVPAESAENIDV